MLRLIKGSILNTIQVDAEVNAALKENTMVVVTKKGTPERGDSPVYEVYACQGWEVEYHPPTLTWWIVREDTRKPEPPIDTEGNLHIVVAGEPYKIPTEPNPFTITGEIKED